MITTPSEETEHFAENPTSGTAVSVEGVSKVYRIWSTPAARLTGPLLEAGKRLFGARTKKSVAASVKGDALPYHDFHALKDISFDLKQNESLGVIGLNGSGKSTLLQIIAGTLQSTKGNVQANGKVAALLELGSGFSPEFTGKENIYLNASLFGLSKQEIDGKYEHIVAFADIGEFIDQPVKTYSSGMIVRLAFAVIAHVDADVLLIDEALAVGDAQFTQKCMRFLRKFREENAILFVTHDIAAVQSLCDRCICLHKGEIRAIGKPKEITELYCETVYDFDSVEPSPGQSTPEPVSSVDNASDNIERSGEQRSCSPKAFTFNPESASFGTGEAEVIDVQLLNADGMQSMEAISGGEKTVLQVRVKAKRSFQQPIIGFLFRNCHGQELFSENTYRWYKNSPPSISKDQDLLAEFQFIMPPLPSGDYFISVAMADGVDASHQQHHWIHEAMLVKSVNGTYSGLVGLPMDSVTLRTT